MGQPHLDPPAIHPAGEKVLTLKALHDGQISQLRELALAEWFTHGGQFQHGPLGIGQVTQPQRDQIDQPGRGAQAAAKTPETAVGGQRSTIQRPAYQLPQYHRVTAAAIGQLPHRRRVHRAREHFDQQLLDRHVVQDAQLDPLSRAVLPQRRHRVRRRLTRADGDQDRRRLGQSQLVHQRRRPAVQQMRVIHEYHQRLPLGPPGHRPPIAPQQLTEVLPARPAAWGSGGRIAASAPNGSPARPR
jgi:hypothetical protein